MDIEVGNVVLCGCFSAIVFFFLGHSSGFFSPNFLPPLCFA